jgi:hypothetical protein
MSRRFSVLFLWSICLCFVLGNVGMSATITVGPSGDYQTVQAAVDAAQAGDVIEISSGTYVEDVSIGDINQPLVNRKDEITLKAAEGATVTIEAANTELRVESLVALGADFGSEDRAGLFVYGNNVTIEGITIYQPSNEPNGLEGSPFNAALTIISSDVTVRECVIMGPGGAEGGDLLGAVVSPMDVGAIMGGESASAINNVFVDCTFTEAPFACTIVNFPLALGVPAPNPEMTVDDCEFYQNGTGIEMDDGIVTAVDCHFHENGNGIDASDDQCTIIDCLIENCSEDAIEVTDSSSEDDEPEENPIVTIDGCGIIYTGESDQNGLNIEHGTITVTNTVISGSAGANVFLKQKQTAIQKRFSIIAIYMNP